MSDKPFINNEQAQAFITRLLTEEQFAGKVPEDTLDAFDDMQSRELPLSAKQLLWVQGVVVKLGLVDEPASNEWSSKTLQERERIRGRDVPTPAVLQHRALRPPHRLHELEKKEEPKEFTLQDVMDATKKLADSNIPMMDGYYDPVKKP